MITKENEWLNIESPAEGRIALLAEAADGVFSDEKMGLGVVIFPTNDTIISPVDGKVLFVFPAKHAVGLETNQGTELFIHIGIDTVTMDAKGFESFVQEGQTVQKGDLLLKFPLKEIQENGYNTATPIIITNKSAADIKIVKGGPVKSGEIIMQIKE